MPLYLSLSFVLNRMDPRGEKTPTFHIRAAQYIALFQLLLLTLPTGSKQLRIRSVRAYTRVAMIFTDAVVIEPTNLYEIK
jgi:hypothetical protein